MSAQGSVHSPARTFFDWLILFPNENSRRKQMAQVNLEIVSNTGLIRHYIAPKLGELRLKEITPRVLEMFYQGLLKTPAVPLMTDKKYRQTGKFVQPPTARTC